MSEHTVRVKLWFEVDIEAESLEEAEDIVWKEIEEGSLEAGIMGKPTAWSEVVSVESQ